MQSCRGLKGEIEASMENGTYLQGADDEELFLALQASEQACLDYLFHLKWPNGFVCPYCGHGHAYTITTRRQPLFECACCKHQTSLTAGTIMERSRTPLTKWFTAIHRISDQQTGFNAVALRDLIHVTYKTAWNMLHSIRQAMSQDENMLRLSGHVHVHSATLALWSCPIGIFVPPKTASVLIGVSLNEEGEPSRVQMQTLETADYQGGEPSTETIEEFCDNNLAPKHQVSSREIKRYAPRKQKKGLSLVHLAGEWLNNTFHGIGTKYRQQYLNEFCCRMNMVLAGLSPFREISFMCARSVSFF